MFQASHSYTINNSEKREIHDRQKILQVCYYFFHPNPQCNSLKGHEIEVGNMNNVSARDLSNLCKYN